MRRNIRGVRLKYLDAIGRFQSGNVRYYYRRAGKRVPMPDVKPDDPRFIAAYAEAHGARPVTQPQTGTIAAGIRAYLASDTFMALAASSRAARRRIMEHIADDVGRATMATLEPRHIRMDISALSPGAALNRQKAWRALGRFWVEAGLLDTDPARDVRKPAQPKSDGHIPWTREDFAAFRAYWQIGTQQRLAFELAYQTCAAAVDLVDLGPKNMADGWMLYTRSKTGTDAVSPIYGPDWFEFCDDLLVCIDAAPKHLTYLTTARGASRSEKAVSSWFSKAAQRAGIKKTLHGVRKGRAAMFRENGAAPDQRMAVLGHITEGETHHYSKSADLQKTIAGMYG